MRNRGTTERRKLREEFVYKWRKEIEALKRGGRLNKKGMNVQEFIERHAVPELEYNPVCYWENIWFTLRRDYRRLFNTDF